MRIGIAGAGLLGRLLAFQLGRAGHEVAVFDPAPDCARTDPVDGPWVVTDMSLLDVSKC